MARHIDWRRQFKRLEPYLDGQGGVVNIRYRGSSCGSRAFLSILKDEFKHRPNATKPAGVSIRLDAENYKVLYFNGIRSEFARVLGKAALNQALPALKSGAVAVAAPVLSHNTATGDQNFELHVHSDMDPDRAADRNDWVSRLIVELREHLRCHRFMIVLLEGSSKDQSEFWTSLWMRASELREAGLLLIRMIDEELPETTHPANQCAHDCEVILLPALDPEATGHAIDDVTALILDQLPQHGNPSVAAGEAKGFVLGHRDNVQMLHDRLVGFIGDLQEF